MFGVCFHVSDDLVVLAFVIAAVALCVSGFMSVLAFVFVCCGCGFAACMCFVPCVYEICFPLAL